MDVRPAVAADIAALAELSRRWELHWLGAVEQSEDELRERIDQLDSLADHSRLHVDGDLVVAAGFWWRSNALLLVDPDVDPSPFHADLIAWFAELSPPIVEALSTDDGLRAALTTRGWQHRHSMFDLLRPVTPDWVLAAPSWPAGVALRDLGPDDLPAVHHLIYVDAAWTDVPGHPERTFDEWRAIFFGEHTEPAQQVLAWRGEQLVGVAIGRIFDDGTGWVSQLAVAKTGRGLGLGRALLLEALARHRAAGATSLGLSVQSDNRNAIRLYLDAGLAVQTEWMEYVPTTAPSSD